MEWFGSGAQLALIVIRAIHFAATAVLAGSLIFRTVVAGPALRSTPAATTLIRTQILRTAWICLAIAAASGLIWLQLETASISGRGFVEAMTSDLLSTVLNETQFGSVTKIRFVLAIFLAACLACDRLALARWLALGAALGLIAAIAWTGHAGSTAGELGYVHLTADVLHLLAAAAWVGGLVPLALLLSAARRNQAWASLACDATQRFSTLGIVSVGALLASGIVNAWILVGAFRKLLTTEYGQVLTLKIVVFALMLMFAAVNRLWLTPQLVSSLQKEAQPDALGQLTRNSVAEIAFGLTIFAIVGALGTLHPAIHF